MDLEAYVIGFQLSPSACSKKAPSSSFVVMWKSSVFLGGSQYARIGIVVNVVLKTLHSVSFFFGHSNSVESWRNSLSANVLTDYFGRNFPIKFIMPITQSIPFLSVGRGMPKITFFFISSGSMPLADILSLKNVISCTPNWYLTPFSLFPFSDSL